MTGTLLIDADSRIPNLGEQERRGQGA